MRPLPVVSATCSLDEPGLRAQGKRYRRVGEGAEVMTHTPRELALRVTADRADELIAELIAVEQECCPFFTFSWSPGERRLSVSVARSEDEPALEAIAFALGLGGEAGA